MLQWLVFYDFTSMIICWKINIFSMSILETRTSDQQGSKSAVEKTNRPEPSASHGDRGRRCRSERAKETLPDILDIDDVVD